MKTVVIGIGDGHDWDIERVIECPDEITETRAAELYAEFATIYFPNKKHLNVVNAEWQTNYDYIQGQIQYLNDQGYEGWNEASVFISWLCEEHGCKEIKYEMWRY